jgi:DNA-directed RNA polymerase specialized sigma24 family protein
MNCKQQKELLHRWLDQGNQEAASQLAEAARIKSIRIVIGILTMRGLCQDANVKEVQEEAWRVVLKKIRSGNFVRNHRAQFTTYYVGIAHMIALGYRRQGPEVKSLPEDLPDKTGVEPLNILISKERLEYLIVAIPQLPEPERTVLCKKHGIQVEGGRIVYTTKMTLEKTGKHFGLKRGWASTCNTKALQMLKKEFDRHFDQPKQGGGEHK